MLKLLKKILKLEGSRFVLVGIANTIIGTSTMLIAYNLFGLGYWISSALNYVVGSIFSYFANKYFTFQSHGTSWKEIVKFVANIALCYVLAYGIAKPLIPRLLSGFQWPTNIVEQISMLAGMCFFVVINFVGQKFFVFQKKEEG